MDLLPPGHDVIDLVSDSDDDFLRDYIQFEDDQPPLANNIRFAGGHADAIDLTGLEDIPDIDIPPDLPHPARPIDLEVVERELVLTDAECLQMVLNVLPDIAVDHVLSLIQERNPRTFDQCEQLITRILDDGAYPKENDEANNRKRKRDDDDDEVSMYENGEQDVGAAGYRDNS